MFEQKKTISKKTNLIDKKFPEAGSRKTVINLNFYIISMVVY